MLTFAHIPTGTTVNKAIDIDDSKSRAVAPITAPTMIGADFETGGATPNKRLRLSHVRGPLHTRRGSFLGQVRPAIMSAIPAGLRFNAQLVLKPGGSAASKPMSMRPVRISASRSCIAGRSWQCAGISKDLAPSAVSAHLSQFHPSLVTPPEPEADVDSLPSRYLRGHPAFVALTPYKQNRA
jgi:hypothetical protein